jgi:hypothetical protein
VSFRAKKVIWGVKQWEQYKEDATSLLIQHSYFVLSAFNSVISHANSKPLLESP